MAATNPIGMIATIETAEDPIVMMTAGEGMVLGMMTAEDTSTGTMIAIVLATNATTTMMMTVMTTEVGLPLPGIATEVMWITGIGIVMKDHGALPAHQKVGANMEEIKQ